MGGSRTGRPGTSCHAGLGFSALTERVRFMWRRFCLPVEEEWVRLLTVMLAERASSSFDGVMSMTMGVDVLLLACTASGYIGIFDLGDMRLHKMHIHSVT